MHRATALAWLLLYVTQALLVAKGRVDLHRRLGWAGPMIAGLLVLFGYYTITEGAFRVSDLDGDIYRILIEPGSPPLTDAENIAGFGGSLGELVIDLAVPFIPAVHDKLTRGRIHPASLWIPLLIIGWYVVLNTVMAPSTLAIKVGSWLLK